MNQMKSVTYTLARPNPSNLNREIVSGLWRWPRGMEDNVRPTKANIVGSEAEVICRWAAVVVRRNSKLKKNEAESSVSGGRRPGEDWIREANYKEDQSV